MLIGYAMINQKSSEAQAETSTPGPGQLLRDERLRRDMTLEHVAEALHLDRKTIGHLEADDYPALPPLTFVQGYVRSYSQLLGMPAEPLLSRLAEVTNDDGASPLIARAGADSFSGSKPRAALRTGPGPLALGLGIILLLAVLVAAGWWLSKNQTELPFINENGEPAEASPPSAQTDAAIQNADSSALPADDLSVDEAVNADTALEPIEDTGAQVPQTERSAPGEQSEMAPAETGESEPSMPAQPTQAEPAATDPADNDQALLFRLSGDSWLEVTDAAGDRLYFGMASLGEQRLTGVPPFDIVIGNTDSVELEFSGETVDLQVYARNKVARFTLGDS